MDDAIGILATLGLLWAMARYTSWAHAPRLTPEERARVNRMLDQRERERPGSTRGRL